MADREFGIETRCLHAGQMPDAATSSRAVPLYQTAAYVFDDSDHAASLFNLQTFGNIYTRLMNPTTAVFEERMASLEGGRAAVATGSGMAAQMVAILTILEAGDEIVSSNKLYGGTYTQFDVNFRKLGINTKFVDASNPANYRDAITDKTKALYTETIGNPTCSLVDFEAIGQIATDAGIPLIVDNTMASPYLFRPFEYGADIVVHSATKFIPSQGYHGVKFYETFGDFGYTMRARCEVLRTMGPTLSPFNSFLFLQGLETLPLRMQRHVENTQAVAEFLEAHSAVNWVSYPGLKSSPDYALAQRYLPLGSGGVLSFGIEGGLTAGQKFIESAEFLSHLVNIGDAKTLITHPASTTHRQMNEAQQIEADVGPDMIRMSVGLETIDDILWDINQALNISQH